MILIHEIKVIPKSSTLSTWPIPLDLPHLEDIGECCQTSLVANGHQRFTGDIIGIMSCTSYAGCIVRGAIVLEAAGASIVGQCNKCNCTMNVAAKVVIQSDGKQKTATMFTDVISSVCGGITVPG